MKYGSIFNLFTISSAIFVTLALVYAQVASPAADKAIEEATTVSVSVLDEVIGSGEQFIVSIDVEPNTTIAGMQFDMSFDPSLVSADSVGEGGFLTQGGAGTWFNSGIIDNVSGTITGVYGAIVSPGEAVSTEGTFATITLTAKTGGANCLLTLSNVIAGDLKGNSVPVKVVNCELEISQA